MLKAVKTTGLAGVMAIGLAGVAVPAHAQMGGGESPFDGAYVGVGVGIINFDYDIEGQNVEDTGFAYQALAGYRRSSANGLVGGVEIHMGGNNAKDDVLVDIGGGENYVGTNSLGRSLGFDGIFGKTFGSENRFLGFVSLGYLNQKVVSCCVVGEPVNGLLPVSTDGEIEHGYRVGVGFEAKLIQNLAWRATVHYSDTGMVDQTQLMTGVTASF